MALNLATRCPKCNKYSTEIKIQIGITGSTTATRTWEKRKVGGGQGEEVTKGLWNQRYGKWKH
jgi:hypothetical protein